MGGEAGWDPAALLARLNEELGLIYRIAGRGLRLHRPISRHPVPQAADEDATDVHE